MIVTEKVWKRMADHERGWQIMKGYKEDKRGWKSIKGLLKDERGCKRMKEEERGKKIMKEEDNEDYDNAYILLGLANMWHDWSKICLDLSEIWLYLSEIRLREGLGALPKSSPEGHNALMSFPPIVGQCRAPLPALASDDCGSGEWPGRGTPCRSGEDSLQCAVCSV